jgi:chromosome segregation ATPase
MDTELKQHLDAMEVRLVDAVEGRINAHVDQRFKESQANLHQRFKESDKRVDERIKESEKRVVTLITEVKESLERQMDHRFDAVDARFDAQANRLDRQAALIQAGSRWSTRMTAWAEKVDLALDKKSEQIVDLHKRIDKAEGGAKQP